MSTISTSTTATDTKATNEVIISSDSHVMEDRNLWMDRLPANLRERAASFGFGGERTGDKPGGHDPSQRIKEMAMDGVSAEVLYPTRGLRTFHIEDPELQEECFRVYNDWIVEYCSVAPDRLIGLGLISTYDVDKGVKELERCAKLGLKGALVWQVPPEGLEFTSDRYDKLWAAAQEMDMPISLHILSGHDYSKELGSRQGMEVYRGSVNLKLMGAMNSLFDLIFSGVMERFPRLKFVLVENEIGWLPFVLSQWDRYHNRHKFRAPLDLTMLPGEYFQRQVYATFFNDPPGGYLLGFWGQDNCMWSNDFPHNNSTWPHSREVIARDLSHLTPEVRAKIVRENCAQLYNLNVQPLAEIA